MSAYHVAFEEQRVVRVFDHILQLVMDSSGEKEEMSEDKARKCE